MKMFRKLSLSILTVCFMVALMFGAGAVKVNAETADETDAKYVTDVSVSLTDDIVMKYYISEPSGYVVKSMTFDFSGNSYEAAFSEKDGKKIAMFTEISPVSLDEKVGYTLVLSNGNEAENKVETVEAKNGISFIDYANKLLAKPASELKFSDDEKTAMDTLLVYVLKYGDAAVAFKGIEKPSFVAAAGEKASLFTDYVVAEGISQKEIKGEGDEVSWKYAGINFAEKLNLYFEFTGNFTSPVKVEFSKNGEKTIVEAENTGTEEEPLYKAYYYGLGCCEFDATVEASVIADGAHVGKTGVYSLKSNVLYFQNSEELPAYAELAKAAFSYGEKAKAFKNAHTHVGTLTAVCSHVFASGEKFDAQYLENIVGVCEKCGKTENIAADTVTAKTIIPEYGKIDGADYFTDEVYASKPVTIAASGYTGELTLTAEKTVVEGEDTYKFQVENPDYVDLSGAKLQTGAAAKLENRTNKGADGYAPNGAEGYSTSNISVKGNVIKLTFAVAQTGKYVIGMRGQSNSNKGMSAQALSVVLSAEIDGEAAPVNGTVKASTTTAWQNMVIWTEIDDAFGVLTLAEGNHTLIVTSLADTGTERFPNIDYFMVSKAPDTTKVTLAGGLTFGDGSTEKDYACGTQINDFVLPENALFVTDGTNVYYSLDSFVVPEASAVTLTAVDSSSALLTTKTLSDKLRYNEDKAHQSSAATKAGAEYTYSLKHSSALSSLKFESAPYDANVRCVLVVTITSSIDTSLTFDAWATDKQGVATAKFNLKADVPTTCTIDIPAGAAGWCVMYFDEDIAANTSFTLKVSVKAYQY